MNRHARAIVSTGMAFPIGVMLGTSFGVAFGDLLFTMLCFFVVPGPLTMLVFWRTTRHLDWGWQVQRAALLRVFGATFVSTGLLILAMWLWTARGQTLPVFLALPVTSLIVTLRAQSALRGVV